VSFSAKFRLRLTPIFVDEIMKVYALAIYALLKIQTNTSLSYEIFPKGPILIKCVTSTGLNILYCFMRKYQLLLTKAIYRMIIYNSHSL